MSEEEKRDFKSIREKLPPESFLIHPDGPNPPPEDLIDKEVWDHINWLTNDVSLRTSDNHGTEIKILFRLWEAIIDQLNIKEDTISKSLLDVADEFQASLFNLLNGYYRVSASCLRNALEISIYALYFQFSDQHDEFDLWLKNHGDKRFNKIKSFGNVCNQLNNRKEFKELNNAVDEEFGFSLFNQKIREKSQGTVRQLHDHLSKFVHSRPEYTHGKMWKSNGPVYAPKIFNYISELYLDTFILIYIFIKLSRPETHLISELCNDTLNGKIRPRKLVVFPFMLVFPEFSDYLK